MTKINLLSSEYVVKEERNELIPIACIIAGLLVIIAILKYLFLLNSYSNQNDKLTQTFKELAKYEDIVKQVDALQATKVVLEAKKTVINMLMTSRLLYPYFLEDVLKELPSNIWFKSVDTSVVDDEGMKVKLEAETLDIFSIADFIAGLTANRKFSSTELGNINTNNSETSTSSIFMLNFNYIMSMK